MTTLDRQQLIALLRRLEGADDQDVLAAGREIAGRVKDSGASWDELLAVSASVSGPDAADPDQSDGGPASGDGEKLSETEAAEAHAAIKAVLARPDLSASTRGDLEDLSGDLAQGRFGRGDLRYVKALAGRLAD